MPFRDAALLLLGHGSTLNADSSAPTYEHAEEIRRRNLFAEVLVGFWKEEPNFRQALRQTNLRRVYVVPNFISSGYFTEDIIPRELGLKGPVTRIGKQEIFYCKPVGLSSRMTEVLLQRAREVVDSSRETFDANKACLFICGHGTSMNDNSTKIIHEQAEIIREMGIYGDCQPVLMEQKPFVKEWRTLTDCPDVIVVPFFISDGLHSYEDIPVLLGLTHNVKEKGFTNPHFEGERRLWYATAIGTAPEIADVILAQVEQMVKAIPYRPSPEADKAAEIAMSEMPYEPSEVLWLELSSRLSEKPMPWIIGQLVIRFPDVPNCFFELRHVDNLSVMAENLFEISSLEELRALIRVDEEGNFRPLRAAPNLKHLWIMPASSPADLHKILDYIYPAAMANWMLYLKKELPLTSWKETAERQTGRFRVVRELDDAGVRELAGDVCAGCLKRRLWSPTEQAVEVGTSEIPLLCPEACNYFVSKAREKLKGGAEEE